MTNPANTTASVFIPTTNNLAGITESGHPAATAPGASSYFFTYWRNWTNGAALFQVGSGAYKFKAPVRF